MPQERILIVEGDIGLAELLTTRLKGMGYLADCVHTGIDALNVLKSTWVDLVIISIILKGEMHGFQLFKETRRKKTYAKIPVIIQSGKPGMKKVFENMGAAAYLTKPYSIEDALKKINDILNK